MSPRLTFVALGAIAIATTSAGAQGAMAQTGKPNLRAEEAAIRAAAQAGAMYTADAIFWSGAYARPIIGQDQAATTKPTNPTAMAQRRNTKRTEDIVRLEVASSGDMAYDFADFTLSYDVGDTGEHTSFSGSTLRVWKKIDGRWTIAATFARPYTTPDTAAPKPSSPSKP